MTLNDVMQHLTLYSFFRTKHHGNIPTRTLQTGPSNAGGIGRNRNSEPISRFIACSQRFDWPGVINTVLPDCGKLWHLTLVVSSRACWWRETTTRSFNITPKTT